MKALSLWEPWATLIARGDKLVETRSWAVSYHRGPIAIHAAKTTKSLHMWRDLWYAADDQIALLKKPVPDHPHPWPLGCIVAIATLEACVPTYPLRETLSRKERAFGDFGIGRFGWVMRDVQALKVPIPARGYQGLWDLDIDVVQSIELQIGKEKRS